MITYIGIDPGKEGAVGILDPLLGPAVIDLTPGLDVPELLRSMQRTHPGLRAVLEMPDARPGRGVRDFVFNAGRLAGHLEAIGVPLVLVPAATWKPRMELTGGSKHKWLSLDAARELWPLLAPAFQRQKDHNRAEALLLALYGQRYRL